MGKIWLNVNYTTESYLEGVKPSVQSSVMGVKHINQSSLLDMIYTAARAGAGILQVQVTPQPTPYSTILTEHEQGSTTPDGKNMYTLSVEKVEEYDYKGALLFVVGLLSIYGIAILFLIISLIMKSQGELELVDNLRDFEAMRRASHKTRPGPQHDQNFRESLRSFRESLRGSSASIPSAYHCNDSLPRRSFGQHKRGTIKDASIITPPLNRNIPRNAWKINSLQKTCSIDLDDDNDDDDDDDYQELAAITKPLHFSDDCSHNYIHKLKSSLTESETSFTDKSESNTTLVRKLRKQESIGKREEDSIIEEDEENADGDDNEDVERSKVENVEKNEFEKNPSHRKETFPLIRGALSKEFGSTEILV